MSTTTEGIYRKTITAVIVFVFLLCTLASAAFVDTEAVYSAGETGKINATDVNVRSGAGTTYSILGTVNKGYTFTVTGTKKDKSGAKWYKFRYKSKDGYVLAKYVSIVKSSSVTAVSNLKGTVTSSDGVNVRKGPGTSYGALGVLAKGKSFNITGKAKDSKGVWWYRLTFSGKTGYVSSQYVKTKSSASTVTAVSNTKGSVISSNGVNVRSGAGTGYSKIGYLKKGKTFTVTGKTTDSKGNKWYRLNYSGRTGYVMADYIKTTKVSQTSENGKADDSRQDNGSDTSKEVSFRMGTVTASDGLNVRSGAGTGYSVLTVLDKGISVEITGSKKASNGKTWYAYKYSSSKTGYICSDYVSVKTVKSDSSFESYLTKQGFPESYKSGLRVLHASHPKWVFKAVKTGYSWSTALSKESVIGRNLVSPSSPKSYRSTASGAYNSRTGAWTRFDGSWYAANSKVIAYYMDPRNFLTENGIYQFMTHRYDSGSQSSATVKAVIKGSFMEGRNPGGGYSSYQSLINAAGKNTGVNPNVLAAMIIQEQGWSGSSLCLGRYPGYKGYYNFFNIGAYTTGSMSAVQRGLWYARNQGWNTQYKSIKGGARFYADSYVKAKQDSYYTKKFNVKNGSANVGTHQYMTNVAAAASEGSLVKRAYSSNSNYPVIFEVPVYNSMPSSACQLP